MTSKSQSFTGKLKENLKLCCQSTCCQPKKRKKQYKMELTEENVDPESKKNMIKHFKDYRLDFFEKKDTAGESFIKVNVGPIVKDKQKMDAFVQYLKSGEYRVKTNLEKSSSNDAIESKHAKHATRRCLSYSQVSIPSSDSVRDGQLEHTKRKNIKSKDGRLMGHQKEVKWKRSSVDQHKPINTELSQHSKSKIDFPALRKTYDSGRKPEKVSKKQGRPKLKHNIVLRSVKRPKCRQSGHSIQYFGPNDNNIAKRNSNESLEARKSLKKKDKLRFPSKESDSFIHNLTHPYVGYMIGLERNKLRTPLITDPLFAKFFNGYVKKKNLADAINSKTKQYDKIIPTDKRRIFPNVNRITVKEMTNSPRTNLKTTNLIFKNKYDINASSGGTGFSVNQLPANKKTELLKRNNCDIVHEDFESILRGNAQLSRSNEMRNLMTKQDDCIEMRCNRIQSTKKVLDHVETLGIQCKTIKPSNKDVANLATSETNLVLLSKLRDKNMDVHKKKEELIGIFMDSLLRLSNEGNCYKDPMKAIKLKCFQQGPDAAAKDPLCVSNVHQPTVKNPKDHKVKGIFRTCQLLPINEFQINANVRSLENSCSQLSNSFKEYWLSKMANTVCSKSYPPKTMTDSQEMDKVLCKSDDELNQCKVQNTLIVELMSEEGKLQCVTLAECLTELRQLQKALDVTHIGTLSTNLHLRPLNTGIRRSLCDSKQQICDSQIVKMEIEEGI